MTACELYGELRKIINRYGNVEVTVVQDRFFVIELYYKLQNVRVEKDSDGEVFIALDPKAAAAGTAL